MLVENKKREISLIYTDQIIEEILDIFNNYHNSILEESKDFEGDNNLQTFINVWEFAKNSKYKADYENQIIKSPAVFMTDVINGTIENDCKNRSIFINSVLTNLGFYTKFIFVKFIGKSKFTHVLSSVIVGNELIPLDSCLDEIFKLPEKIKELKVL